jgi:predicted transcriptional regulator
MTHMSNVAPSPSESSDAIQDDGGEAHVITVKEKWQGAVTEGSGFVAVPMSLLRLQSKYDLTATDMVVLINLLAHWWDPARPVYPRSTTVAKRMGVTKRTVQRSTERLLKSGMMEREFLEDGRRVFSFDLLAHRLSKDVHAAYEVQASERALLKRDITGSGLPALNENEPPTGNPEAAQTLRSPHSRRPQE